MNGGDYKGQHGTSHLVQWLPRIIDFQCFHSPEYTVKMIIFGFLSDFVFTKWNIVKFWILFVVLFFS